MRGTLGRMWDGNVRDRSLFLPVCCGWAWAVRALVFSTYVDRLERFAKLATSYVSPLFLRHKALWVEIADTATLGAGLLVNHGVH
jgi:hypothetical protein